MAGAVPQPQPAPARDVAIDWLRGLVMVIMALDHARDSFSGFRINPTDLATTTPLLFFTRWITHYCAPVFIFLAGTAAALYAAKRSVPEVRRFLLGRGLLLVALELTVVRLGWIPDPTYHFSVAQVIWAIGWSMVLLSALVALPRWALVAFGAVLVAGHDLLDPIHADALGNWGWLWALLHEQRPLHPLPGRQFFVIYPLIPWVGVMALGYAFGGVARLPVEHRRRVCLRLGGAAIAAFVIIRGIDRYGDPHPWTGQRDALFTLMSFLNCTKYPPSLDYLLMTLGPALVALALAPARAGRATRALVTFGQVPLFFYVAHIYLLRYGSLPFGYHRFGAQALLPPPEGTMGSPEWPLIATYVSWAVAVIVLYPACRWYAGLKPRKPYLRYF